MCVNATISNTSLVKVIVDGEQERCCQEAVRDEGRKEDQEIEAHKKISRAD
jgi:hypothetical protein